MDERELAFYATPGRMTDLSRHAGQADALPSDIADLCRIVQGLVVHAFLGPLYGLEYTDEQREHVQIRAAAEMLDKILEIDPAPLTEERPPEKRFVGNCRHFTTLSTAILRHHGKPARGRCGFGTYFNAPNLDYVDHWVVERWDDRWILTDAQLDHEQIDLHKITFYPLDVPRDAFIDGGRAWQLYRAGKADGDRFGVLDMHGPWFIKGDLMLDLASLNKVELLPWDSWGLGMSGEWGTPEFEAAVDDVAVLTTSGSFDEIRARYESDVLLRVPSEITSFTDSGPVKVTL
jgi:hypothetical protein